MCTQRPCGQPYLKFKLTAKKYTDCTSYLSYILHKGDISLTQKVHVLATRLENTTLPKKLRGHKDKDTRADNFNFDFNFKRNNTLWSEEGTESHEVWKISVK